MSLSKTALACLLLAALAPWARAQEETASYAEPDAPQAVCTDSPEYGSTDAGVPDSGAPGYQPQANGPANLWNGGVAAPDFAASAGCYADGCSADGCSGPPASSYLGTYRFGGGNPNFAGPWYITADAFLLHRSNGNANVPIVQDSFNNYNTLLSAQDLKFTSKVGPRVMLGYAWSHTTAFEVSYFGLIDSRTQSNLSGAGNLSLPPLGLSFVATDFNGASQMTVNYNSRLNNAEFNVLKNTGASPLSWLYGFRYLGLNEHLDINAVGLLATADYNVMTRNNLFGIQGGARYMFSYKRLAVESTVKAGVLENATEQSQNVFDGGVPFRDAFMKGANVSFLGEVGINAIYRIGEKWAIRGGYTLIWVDGLALAPNQLDYTFTATSGTGLNHGGNVLMQGLSAGVELHW